MKEVLENATPSTVGNLIERSILDVGIPPCPVVLDRFMTEARKNEPDFNLLAHNIGSDVGISAGLIKTANSSFFGTRQRARSVNEALALLGMKTTSVYRGRHHSSQSLSKHAASGTFLGCIGAHCAFDRLVGTAVEHTRPAR